MLRSHGLLILVNFFSPGKYDAIFDMLAEMNVPERSSAIYDWAIGGQILFDFIWLRRNLDAGKQVRPFC